MNVNSSQVAGSFRDPGGQVHIVEGCVLRKIAKEREGDVRDFLASSLYRSLERDGWIVQTEIVDWPEGVERGAWSLLVRHARLQLVSYPYEWCFSALRDAAIFHLELQLRALDAGYVLADASAYNVQFVGARPVFIDLLSFRRYREGEYWWAHRQFVEQFVNPLLLQAKLQTPFNAWYRGNLEGIASSDIVRLLPLRAKLQWGIFANVVLPTKGQRASGSFGVDKLEGLRKRVLSKAAYSALLHQMKALVESLKLRDTEASVWQHYDKEHSYSVDEQAAKKDFVARFVSAVCPRTVVDFGCNSGEYSELCLEAGAEHVTGLDFDQGALDRAFARAKTRDLAFTPLFLDAANPSPDQGWNQSERSGINRIRADAAVALAFEHHLTIGRNIPIDQFAGWLAAFARCGVVEFVPKEDPTVRRMLAVREDIFPDYNQAAFERALQSVGRIVDKAHVSANGRTLYRYVSNPT